MAKSTRASAIRFFVVSALSGFEYFLYRTNSHSVSTTSLFTCVIFLFLAFFAYRMSRAAFMGAILFYGCTTAMMVSLAMTSNLGIEFILKTLIARCLLIYNLHQKYCQLTALHELENF